MLICEYNAVCPDLISKARQKSDSFREVCRSVNNIDEDLYTTIDTLLQQKIKKPEMYCIGAKSVGYGAQPCFDRCRRGLNLVQSRLLVTPLQS